MPYSCCRCQIRRKTTAELVRDGVKLFADAAEGHMRRLSLLEAGLLASGVDDLAEVAVAREQFAAARAELLNLIHGAGVATSAPVVLNVALCRF